MINLSILKKDIRTNQVWIFTNHLTGKSGPRKVLKVEERRVLFEDAHGAKTWWFFPDADSFVSTGHASFDIETGPYNDRKKVLSLEMMVIR